MFQHKPNYSPVYDEHGFEDVDATYRRMVYNVRILVEGFNYTVNEAVQTVEIEMSLTPQESMRLLEKAKEKYEDA